MAKGRSPAVRASLAFGFDVLTGGLWALISPDTLTRLAPVLIGLGAVIVAVAYFWDELRAYRRWKRGPRHVYISWLRERLPADGPPGTFKLYRLHEADGRVFPSYSEHRGNAPADPEFKTLFCERIEVTNHSDATLVNVGVKLNLDPMPLPDEPKRIAPQEIMLEFEQIRAGQQGVTFVVNECPRVINAWVLAASGTPVGGTQAPLEFSQKTFGIMVLYPHPRFDQTEQASA